jgi:hypothetical protein
MLGIDDLIELKDGERTTLRKLADEDRITICQVRSYGPGGGPRMHELCFAEIYGEGEIEISAAVFDKLKDLDVPVKPPR